MRTGRTKSIPIQVYADEELKSKVLDLVRDRQRRTPNVASISSVLCELIEQAHEKTFSDSDSPT